MCSSDLIMQALRALAHALDGDSASDDTLHDGAPRRGDGPERPSGKRTEP